MRHLFWGLFLLKRNKRLNNCEKWALKNTHNNATRPNLWVEKSAPAFSFFGGELYFQINVRPSNFKNLASFSAKDQRNLFLGELQLKSQNSFACDIFFEILSLKRNSSFCTSPHFSDHCGLLYFLFSLVFLWSGFVGKNPAADESEWVVFVVRNETCLKPGAWKFFQTTDFPVKLLDPGANLF